MPRGEEDGIGIVLVDRDRLTARQAAAGLVPGATRVVRDREWRPSAEERYDRRAGADAGDDAGQ